MKKNTKVTFSRSFSILAAAALSMTLIGGQTFPAYAGNSSGIESGAVIPDNITIDSPTALANIALPSNAYGTLSWVDSSYVPDKRVQSCGVVFKPAAGADLSGLPGWDSNSGTLTGSVTVVVSSLDSAEENSESGESSDSSDPGESYGTDDKEENGTDVNESDTDTSVNETEDSTAENEEKNEGLQDNSAQENKEDPEITEKADQSSSDSSDTTDAADASGEGNKDPEITETPEITAAPSEDDKTQDGEEAEAVETPAVTITPAAEESTDPDAASENRDDENHEKNNDAEITAIPEITETPDAEENENKDNIFDRKDDTEDKRPQNAATDLTETEKEEIASQNHTCDGITVSGIDLPWYVQFRVSGGEDYQFTNEEDATIFKSYEFELWDTQNNTEYKIPDGEYISVTVPVKAGYTYSIEHLLDNGAMETIIPSVDGDTMTFSTHSFSPFGIAGSKSLVGPDAENNTGTAVTPAAAAASSDTAVADTANSAETDDTDNNEAETSRNLTSDSTDDQTASSQNSDTAEDEAEDQSSVTTSKKQVNTGDNTQILPFVILFVAAAVVAGVAVFFKKRKK